MVAAAGNGAFTIEGRPVGGGRCFVIAEAGVNHNGDVALAHQLVDVAADAGVDAVKFQTFDPDALVAADAPKAAYQIEHTGASESQLDMLRRLALPLDAFIALAEHARRRGIIFLSTAFDEGSAEFLNKMEMAAFKIPSGELTNPQLLARIARFGRPLLVSTGMATLDEVAAAVAELERTHANSYALFHCVSNYPASAADCNLRAMETMRARFHVPVGWSDHTEGIEISVAAVAAGAELLEKHITLDRALPGPDHAASLEPSELVALMKRVRTIEDALGDGVKQPRPSEQATAAVARRSLHADRALPEGTVLTAEDLVALRPGTGLPPFRLAEVVGRRLKRTLTRGDMLRDADLA